MSILFVGGPLDGIRQPLPPDCGGVLHTFDRSIDIENYSRANAVADTEISVHTHVYTMQAIGSHRVMMHDSVPHIIEALIKGYHRKRKPLSPMARMRAAMRRRFPNGHAG